MMKIFKSRIEREKQTVGAMIELYCRLEHGSHSELCNDCRKMREYILLKLGKCPYEDDKPTCLNCTIHCYKPAEREKIREIMRYAGPKMLIYHPILALLHLYENNKKETLH
jgi:hypothetical protein